MPLSIHDDGDEAAASAVRRAYRKASLAVHPDKCVHPRAKEAFEVLGRAQRILLADDDAGRETLADLRPVLEHAREQVRETWRKDAERDATAKLEALLHPDGLVGVQRDAEQGQEFQDAWRQRARELLTQAEWRRRTIEKRRAEEKAAWHARWRSRPPRRRRPSGSRRSGTRDGTSELATGGASSRPRAASPGRSPTAGAPRERGTIIGSLCAQSNQSRISLETGRWTTEEGVCVAIKCTSSTPPPPPPQRPVERTALRPPPRRPRSWASPGARPSTACANLRYLALAASPG